MDRPSKYILNDAGEPEPVGDSMADIVRWGTWYADADRSVGDVTIPVGDKSLRVSTVFLGSDHGYSWGLGDPILWETMVFLQSDPPPHPGKGDGSWTDHYCNRYSSREAAQTNHARLVEYLMSKVGDGASVPTDETLAAWFADYEEAGE